MRARLPARPFLYPIVDVTALGGRDPAQAAAALARGGARLLQLRAKQASDRELVRLARGALLAAREAGALLLIDDRPDVCRIVGADGVHVGQADLPPREARRVVGETAIVGFSTHNLEQLLAGASEDIDYLAFGPVFETRSKRAPDPVVGLAGLREARAQTRLPLVAIGGIGRENAAAVVGAGADGLAAISDLLACDDLEAAARDFVRALQGAA